MLSLRRRTTSGRVHRCVGDCNGRRSSQSLKQSGFLIFNLLFIFFVDNEIRGAEGARAERDDGLERAGVAGRGEGGARRAVLAVIEGGGR